MVIRTEMFAYSSTLSWMPYGDIEGEGSAGKFLPIFLDSSQTVMKCMTVGASAAPLDEKAPIQCELFCTSFVCVMRSVVMEQLSLLPTLGILFTNHSSTLSSFSQSFFDLPWMHHYFKYYLAINSNALHTCTVIRIL